MKPSFWADTVMASLRPEVRLTYIGLWCEADDAGWLELDLPAIAHDLYGYESRAARERHLSAHITALVAASRIIVHDCGHAQVPTLRLHQRIAGNQTFRVRDEHVSRCSSDPSLRSASHSPGKVSGKWNGTERNGKVARDPDASSAGSAPGKERARLVAASTRPLRLLAEPMPVAASAALAVEDEP